MAARKRSKSRKRTPARKKAPARKATRRKVARKKAPAKKKKTARKTRSLRKPTRRKATSRKQTTRKAVRKPAPARAARPAPVTAKATVVVKAPPQLPTATPAPASPALIAAGIPVEVGKVTHYFGHVNAAIVTLEAGELRVGDMVHFRGHTTDFYQRVDHMEVDHAPVQSARTGQVIGLRVSQRVRENDVVSKVAR